MNNLVDDAASVPFQLKIHGNSPPNSGTGRPTQAAPTRALAGPERLGLSYLKFLGKRRPAARHSKRIGHGRRPAIKIFQFRIRSLLIAVALAGLILAVLASYWRTPSRPYSTVFARFEPADLIWPRAGYTVHDTGLRGGGSSNPTRGDAEREWRGFIEALADPALSKTIMQVIDAYIKRESKGRYSNWGLSAKPEPHLDARVPRHAEIMFNQGEWHGEMQIWLFPDSGGAGRWLCDLPPRSPEPLGSNEP